MILAPTAQAVGTLNLEDGQGQQLQGPYKAWADKAHVPLPTGTVRVSLDGCPGRDELIGCVITRYPRTIYLRAQAPRQRWTFLHELGHVFDLTAMRQRDRRAFKRVHGRAGRSWWGGTNPTGEWFAEAYSLCARYGGRLRAHVSTTYHYQPSLRRHRASCRVIRAASAQPGHRIEKPPAPPTLTEAPRAPEPAPAPAPAPAPPNCFLFILCG